MLLTREASTAYVTMSDLRHIALYISPYPWSRSMVLVPGCINWLAEISADLWEAVAHLRRVRDDKYKSTVTLRYFTCR